LLHYPQGVLRGDIGGFQQGYSAIIVLTPSQESLHSF